MSDLKNVDVVYYSRDELIANSSLYYPDKKENNSIFDICFLQQVKANLYNQTGENVGIFNALNTFNSDNDYKINTGTVSLKTDKGIVTFINTYSVDTSTEPYFPNIVEFMKAVYASGIYSKNGLDVYVKLTRFDDEKLTRKIEIFYN